ncbi:MAG: hypothetical protein HZC54_07995 [Verrucomicrobia bacterium]|nr:hypothetical protein [Verrucomicrobiota bacterium]
MLVVTAVMLVGMIAMLGLVMGSGVVHSSRRHAQRAADAAAQAGARQLLAGTNSTQRAKAQAAALYYASLNGANTNNVLIEIPPAASSGSAFAGSNKFIRVEVALPTPIGLMRLFTNRSLANVRASATGGAPLTAYTVTVVTLGEGRGMFSTGGTATLDTGTGAIRVNSSHPQAVVIGGTSYVHTSNMGIVGGYSGTIDGSVTTGTPLFPDPFADKSWPKLSDYRRSPDSGGNAMHPDTLHITSSAPVTLRPGIYYGGIRITGSGPVTLLPGTYIMAGGGLEITGSASLTGIDVFIYNTNDPTHPTGDGDYGEIRLEGTGDISLQAPTKTADSTYYGFSIVNDPLNNEDVRIRGTATGYFGVVYARNSLITLIGNGTFGGLEVVSRALQVQGNGTFGVMDPERIPDAGWKAVLVE